MEVELTYKGSIVALLKAREGDLYRASYIFEKEGTYGVIINVYHGHHDPHVASADDAEGGVSP